MINLYCGYDAREAIGFHVFVASVLAKASVPVAIHPLNARSLPQGSNTFTFSRFLVPALMNFRGRAIFADACDMLMLGDVAELDRLFDPSKAVQVVPHDYRTRNPQKYIGTPMQCPNRDYPRKNWASLMLINCEHPAWRSMSPARIAEFATIPTTLLGLNWLADDEIGFLPDSWNVLADEGQNIRGAQLLHWTAGIPAFPYYSQAPGSESWHAQHAAMLEAA